MNCKVLLRGAFVLSLPLICQAQRSPEYDAVTVPQNRMDARDLGYPPVDVIPNGNSAVTSLTVAPNGNLYGATSGSQSYLFVVNPRHGYVQPLGFVPDATGISHALVVSNAGAVYLGTPRTGISTGMCRATKTMKRFASSNRAHLPTWESP